MLTSSDAKFRCLWHMFVWSIMLTLVSQFYVLSDHIAFYIFGSICILVLPIVTSLYSNTAGRRGAGLLRVAYVLCDPVIACIALVPVLLIKRLTPLIHEMECLSEDIHSWNESLACLGNPSNKLHHHISNTHLPFKYKTAFWLERRQFLTAIEVSITIPCILACLMGRRTRKMNFKTGLLVFCYWLVASIECAGMIEASVLCGSTRLHYAVTTEVTVCVACILANSYGLVTLCSYISPMQCKGDKEQVAAHFDLVYKCVVGVLGVAFVELPQLIARFQMLVATSDWPSASDINSFIYESHGGRFGGGGGHKKHLLFLDENADILNISTTLSTPKTLLTYSSFVQNILSKLARNPSLTSTTPNLTIISPSTHSIIPTTTDSFANIDKLYRLGFPPSFYLWAFKDAIMILIIIALLVLQGLAKGRPAFMKLLNKEEGCVGTAFDNLNTVFMPEKRDKYIITRCAKCRQIDMKDGGLGNHRNHHRSNHSSSRRFSRQSVIDYPNQPPTNSHHSATKSTHPQTSFLEDIDKQVNETSFSNKKADKMSNELNRSDDFKVVQSEKLKEYNTEINQDSENVFTEALLDDDIVEENVTDYNTNDLSTKDYIAPYIQNYIYIAHNSAHGPSSSGNNDVGTSQASWVSSARFKGRFYSLDDDALNKKKKSVKFSLS